MTSEDEYACVKVGDEVVIVKRRRAGVGMLGDRGRKVCWV